MTTSFTINEDIAGALFSEAPPHFIVPLWHEMFGIKQDLTTENLSLGAEFIEEEFKEFKAAATTFLEKYEEHGVVSHEVARELIKELFDLHWVVLGMYDRLGLHVPTIFSEGAMSNFSKLGPDGKPVYREDGKVMKGPNYRPPEFGFVMSHLPYVS